MVHSRRRHGLYNHELAPVYNAIMLRLQQLVEERTSFYEALTLFKVLYRIETHHTKPHLGRCRYPPEINWKLIEEHINGPLMTPKDLIDVVAEEG